MAVCRVLGHYGDPCGTPQEVGFYVFDINRTYNSNGKYDVAAFV